jgi:hypothetical protein
MMKELKNLKVEEVVVVVVQVILPVINQVHVKEAVMEDLLLTKDNFKFV